VLSGESASLRVQRVTFYPAEFEYDIEEIGEEGDFLWTLTHEERSYVIGTLLNITPTIMPDKKHVILNISAELRDFFGFRTWTVLGPATSIGQPEWQVPYPETEISKVETRVSVPDGGTLLLGGQRVSAETELESGVPVLSRIPVLGRLFSNRSKVKDSKILLILVKPTIILQEEAEAEAIASMR
jgi:type II secretory pathway component GspD/PulD (secretin)